MADSRPNTPTPRPPARLADRAGMRMLLPIGRSGWAIASGYLGLCSMLLVPGPFAVITGIVAIADIRRHPDRHGMGRAVFGIVAGSLGTIGLIWWIVRMPMM